MNTTENKDPYPTDPLKLKEACERYETILTSAGLTNFFRADYFDIDELRKIMDLCQSEHVKVYYGVDERNRHFLFAAPTQADGRARTDINDTVAICCCQRPPCPAEDSDRYVDI